MTEPTELKLDEGTLIQVLQNRLAQAAVREAQMEAAIMQLRQAQSDKEDDGSLHQTNS